MNPIIRAAQFAHKAHEGQTREYNGLPYITHPSRVAGRAAALPEATEEFVIAAFLHDVVEDTKCTLDEIEQSFGPKVAAIVGELTNPSTGMSLPRNERKRMDREHLAGVSRQAKLIKLLDRIDNLRELHVESPASGFPQAYAEESAILVEAIGDVDDQLRAELEACIDALQKHLANRSSK